MTESGGTPSNIEGALASAFRASSWLSSAKLLSAFRGILALTGLLSTVIICAAFLYLVFSLVCSKQNLAYGLTRVGLGHVADSVLPPGEFERFGPERADFEIVQDFSRRCRTSESEQLPAETALSRLNYLVEMHRRTSRGRADSAFALWQIASVVTITLGMVTTILVSMSSTEFGRGDGTLQRCIRVLAIVFPALGTAAAAIIAFYSPQIEFGQASRTLNSLSQLQSQIAVGVLKAPCVLTKDDDNSKQLMKSVDEWSRRYVDIQTVSAESTGPAASASGSSSGQTPGAPGGGQPPAAATK